IFPERCSPHGGDARTLVPKLLFGNAIPRNSVSRTASRSPRLRETGVSRRCVPKQQFGNENLGRRMGRRPSTENPMPLFGAHTSIAGGCHKALESDQAHGMETVQLFTKSSNQWNAKPLTDEDLATFRRLLRETGLRHP